MLRNLSFIVLVVIGSRCTYSQDTSTKTKMDKNTNPVYSKTETSKVSLPESEWQKVLTPEVFRVAREKGTERPWTSEFENSKEIGTYYCKACGNALFVSDTKFDSGCGWPSFYQAISDTSIIYHKDKTHGMIRTEVVCGRCDAHLGHLFDDGPPPTHKRFCINGVVLDFEKK